MVFSFNISFAEIGTSCSNPYILGVMEGNSFKQQNSSFWLKFELQSDTLQVDFIPLTANNIDSIIVYTGTCGAKVRVNSVYTGNVNDKVTYYFNSTNGLHFIQLYKDTNNLSPLIKSSIIIKSLGGNPIVCDPICPGVSTSCEMICNPSFEHYDSAPDNEGQIERACPWANHGTGTTPDFFHEDYNGTAPNINMDVPINAFDNIAEHNGLNGYAGIIAVGTDPDDLYTYHEYLTGKLRFQLQQGLTYYFSTWVYKACISEIQVDELGVYFSSAPVTQNGTDYLNLTPQLSFSNINTNNGNWAHLTGIYLATGNEEYLTFGFFKAGNANNISNTPIAEFCATYPPNGTNNIATNNGSEWAYYFVDDFQLLPNNPIAVEEIEVCYAPTMVTLNAPTNIGNVTWSPGGYTGTTITVPITANYTTYTYTGSIYQGCQVSGIVNITNTQSCCFNEEAGGEVLFAIDGSQSPFYASDLINMNGGNIVSPVGAQNTLLINGEFIVDANLTFTNYLDVQLSTNSKITIRNGITFTIKDFTVLRACDEMWDGIYMNGLSNLNASNIPKLKVFNGVTIQDMENGIVCNNNAIYEIGNHQASVKLNKNYKNITVTGYSDGISYSAMHPSFVKNCRFTCQASQYTQPDDYLISPHSNQVTFYGVNILKVDNITIGAATPMQSNLFENMNFGIISRSANINVYNNFFKNITAVGAGEDCNCKCRAGAAICSEGRQIGQMGLPGQYITPANTANIGGTNLYQSNSFENCFFGIDFTKFMNGNIIDNSFDKILVYGIYARNHYPIASNNTFINIEENEFHDVYVVHNYIVNYSAVPKLITNNDYNLNTLNIYTIEASAIVVEDASNVGVTNLNINDNDIKVVQYGINCKNQNRAVIYDNRIELSTLNYVVDNDRSHGIKIDHCNRATVSDNLISADNRDNWWTHGITADYSDDSHIFCNHTYKTGHGIVWSGSYSNPKIFNNNMHRNAAGLTLNWASFGQQLLYSGTNGPAPMYADNIWVGPYANYFHTKVYTCLTCPPIGIMHARPQQGTAYLPNPFYAFSDPLLNELKPDAVFPALGTIQWINAEPNNHYCNLQSAQETSDILPVSNANLLATENQNIPNSETADGYWWEVYQKYMKLMADTLPDAITVNWLDSMSTTAIGQLYAVGTNINPQTTDATTIANLQTQNNLISAQTQQEVVFKNANALWLQALQFLNDSNYVGYPDTSFDFNSVKTIAWECPKSNGPGVFSMRVLANKLDTVWVNYNNDCEQPPNVNEERSSIYYAQAADNDDETHDYDFLIKSEDASSIKNFIVYPNPSDGIFNIDFGNENIGTNSIKMYNSMGQQVEMTSLKINSQIITLDLSNAPKGLYIFEILEGNKVVGRSKLSLIK
jgi:hypothetical protein